MSEAYGIYVSIRNVDGVLVSSTRATVSEVMSDLEGLYDIMAEFSEISTKGATDNVSSILGTSSQSPQSYHNETEIAQTGPNTNQFETCSKCGSPKSKWVPPGTSSRTGKPYPGFFGCSNTSCR